MKSSLEKKHAIICGSTDGIGRSTAILFASLGCEVTLVARDQEKLEAIIERWIMDPSSFIGPDGNINNLFFQKEL